MLVTMVVDMAGRWAKHPRLMFGATGAVIRVCDLDGSLGRPWPPNCRTSTISGPETTKSPITRSTLGFLEGGTTMLLHLRGCSVGRPQSNPKHCRTLPLSALMHGGHKRFISSESRLVENTPSLSELSRGRWLCGQEPRPETLLYGEVPSGP